MRKFAAILLASAFVVSVAACSDLPAEVQGCVPTYTSGPASKAISANGDFGNNPDAKVPTPTITKRVEVSTLTKGKGLLLGKHDVADIQLSLYTAADGKLVGSTGSESGYARSSELQADVGSSTNAISRSLMCQRVGTRVVSVLTAAQYFGTASEATSNGIDPKTVIVAVSDIMKGYRGRATGILQPLQSGFPSVVTSGDGTPGLTLDLQEPPKTLQYEVVRGGSGAKVKAGQQVLLQVQGVEWSDPAPTTTFDSTWTSHTPRYYKLTALAKNKDGQFLDKGSVKALVGQRVGSQVLVVVPPKDGYPKGKAPSGYPATSTLIFVYDILGTY
ncbi:MAG TPA: FKBP-type peptidyl-prolyl cis-trans isomerase [Galbitalea sp.]